MIKAHERKGIRYGYYSIVELNHRWDPQTTSGNLMSLVDVVTPGKTEDSEKLMVKILEWETKAVDASSPFVGHLHLDVRTALIIAMSPAVVKSEIFKYMVFHPEFKYHKVKDFSENGR